MEVGPRGPPSVTLTLLAAGPSAYWTFVHVDLSPYGHPSRELANVVASERTRRERADHAVRAMKKGALGVHEVSGPEPPGVFKVLTGGAGGTGGH